MAFFFGPHRIQYSGVCFVSSLNDTRCSVSIIRPVKAPCHCRISLKGKWYNERNQTVSLSKDRIKAALQRGITGAANSGILPFLSLLAKRGLNPRRLETLLEAKTVSCTWWFFRLALAHTAQSSNRPTVRDMFAWMRLTCFPPCSNNNKRCLFFFKRHWVPRWLLLFVYVRMWCSVCFQIRLMKCRVVPVAEGELKTWNMTRWRFL